MLPLLALLLALAPAQAQEVTPSPAQEVALSRTVERARAEGIDGEHLVGLIGLWVKDPRVKKAVKVWELKATKMGMDGYRSADGGVMLRRSGDVIDGVILFRHAKNAVPDGLPADLHWGMMEPAVRARLGAPVRFEHGTPVFNFGDLEFELSIYAPSTSIPGLEVMKVRAAKEPARGAVVAASTPAPAASTPSGTGASTGTVASKPAATATTAAVSTAAVATPSAASKPTQPPVVVPTPGAPAPARRIASAADLPELDTPVRTGRRADSEAAVVIGLESYAFIPGVPHARRDAGAFFDHLIYTRGIPGNKAQLLTRGGREHIVAAVERAAREAGRGGRVWIYFAGHGAADPSTSERMLLGDDVRADAIGFASRGVPLVELERLVTEAGAEPILVLDTCYSGAGRTGEAISSTRFLVPDYAKTPAGKGAQWTAAGPNQLSAPLPGRDHGAFTYFVLGALRGWADGELDGKPDGAVTAAEAQAFVARALRRFELADQQPAWVGPDDLELARGVTERAPF